MICAPHRIRLFCLNQYHGPIAIKARQWPDHMTMIVTVLAKCESCKAMRGMTIPEELIQSILEEPQYMVIPNPPPHHAGRVSNVERQMT